MQTNARTKVQKTIATQLYATLDDPEFTDGHVMFKDGTQQVEFLVGEHAVEFPNYQEARSFAADPVEWVAAQEEDTPAVQPESHESTPPAPETSTDTPEPVESLSEPRPDLEEAFDLVLSDLISDLDLQNSGERNANEARYAKGLHLLELERVGNQLKASGHPDFQERGAVLTIARREFDSRLSDAGIVEKKRRSMLSAQETSMVRKVADTYLRRDLGLATSFRAVNTLDPDTGQQIADDSGNPPELPVSSVPLNNLYLLASHYEPDEHDEIVAFAARTAERDVGKMKRVLDDAGEGKAATILRAFASRVANEPERLYDEVLREFVAEARQESAEPTQIKTLRVDAAWYDGIWKPFQEMCTRLYEQCGLMLDEKGRAPNTQLVERIFAAHGFTEATDADQIKFVAGLFLSAGDIDEKQALAFVEAELDVLGASDE